MIQVILGTTHLCLLCYYYTPVMKIKLIYLFVLLLASMSALESCGRMVISSRYETPPPPWFYHNRVEMVRYVYFPDYVIYYDLLTRNYIYFDSGVWISVHQLPPRFNTINLRKTKKVRINNFFGDNVNEYHRNNTYAKNKRSTASSRKK